MAFSDLIALADRAVRDRLGSVPVVYAPAVGAPVNITGIFDANYVLADEGHSGVEQVTPAVWLNLADLPLHPDLDEPQLSINGTLYKVRERQPDTMGSIRLLLHRVAI